MGEVSGRPSMQERMRLRRASEFVGRVAEVASFQANLRLPPDDLQRRFLYTVYGDAGVGKSSLVRHLAGIARKEGALCATIDYPVNDVLAAMDTVAGQFALASFPMTAFSAQLAAYRRHRRDLENDPNAPRGSGRMLAKMALRVGLRAAGDVPVVGALAEELDADIIVEQTERLRSFIGSKIGKHDDAQLLLTPVEVLTPTFVADIRRLAGQSQIALFFDTYERTAPVLDDWLREVVDGRHGDLPDKLTITVAGQHELDANRWGEYLGEIVQMPLNPFSDGDARELLKLHGVTDERIVDVILTLSGRLPLLLAMLAKGNPADPRQVGDRSGEAVDRFLKWVDDGRHRRVALLAALPRLVNQDVLSALVKDDDVDGLFEWLRGQPFLSEAQGVCRYHDVVRTPMLRQQRGQAPQRWRQNHTALADAYAGWRGALGLAEDDGWDDSRWCGLALEETYHRLCSDTLPAMPGALGSLVYALRAKRSAARTWAEMVQQAGHDADIGQIEQTGARLLESIDASAGMVPFLSIVLDQPGIADKPKLVALFLRARAQEAAHQTDLAIRDYDRVIEVDPNDARAMLRRSQLLREMGRKEEALADLTRAIEVDPGDALGFSLRGQLLREMGRKEEALADLTRAIEVGPGDAARFFGRSHLLREMGRNEEALADLTRAIEVGPGDAAGVSVRGVRPGDMGRYEEALANLTRVIEFIGFLLRGQLLRRMGRYEDALVDLTRAIELKPEDGWTIGSRGQTYRQMGRYEDALDDFTRAIELNPEDDWAIGSRGQTYRQMGRYEDALVDLTRAIELKPEDGWTIAQRGQTYRQMGRYEDALVDLTRAIELKPEDGWTIAQRGQTYRQMARREEAVADFTRAIELNPEYGWAIGSRGQTYRQMGRYEDALVDLTRAIELEPEDGWTIAQRGQTYRQMGRYEDALVDLTRAIELNPEDDWPRYCRSLAHVELRQGEAGRADLRSALAAATATVQRRPGDFRVVFNVALYHAALGDADEAARIYESNIRSGAPDDRVQAALDDLHQFANVAGSSVHISQLISLLQSLRPPQSG